MRLLRAGDHRLMPWKNGLGVTREVAVGAHPDDPGRFVWRISLATVTGSAPFSPFPGIDRTIAVLSGAGMRLTVEGEEAARELTPATPPFRFCGDLAVDAECLDGETTDLNVMTLRSHCRHEMSRLVLERPTRIAVETGHAAVVFTGDVRVEGDGPPLVAGAFDALVALNAGDAVDLVPAGPGSAVFVIRFTPV